MYLKSKWTRLRGKSFNQNAIRIVRDGHVDSETMAGLRRAFGRSDRNGDTGGYFSIVITGCGLSTD